MNLYILILINKAKKKLINKKTHKIFHQKSFYRNVRNHTKYSLNIANIYKKKRNKYKTIFSKLKNSK